MGEIGGANELGDVWGARTKWEGGCHGRAGVDDRVIEVGEVDEVGRAGMLGDI